MEGLAYFAYILAFIKIAVAMVKFIISFRYKEYKSLSPEERTYSLLKKRSLRENFLRNIAKGLSLLIMGMIIQALFGAM